MVAMLEWRGGPGGPSARVTEVSARFHLVMLP